MLQRSLSNMSGYRAELRSEATKTANEELSGRTRGTTDNKGVAPTRDSYGKTKVHKKIITVYGSFFVDPFAALFATFGGGGGETRAVTC